MDAIQVINWIVDKITPLIALYAWWSVHRHNKIVERKLTGTDHRINGRMDELIQAKEQIAYRQGRADAVAEALLTKEKD